MAADFYIAQGDTASPLTDTLKDADGNAVDIFGTTVTLTAVSIDGTVVLDAVPAAVDQNGAGDDGSKGKLHYGWQESDTANADTLLARWTVTFADDSVQTYPNGGYILIEITPAAPTDDGIAFATSSELAARLGLEFTADEHVRAATLLTLASGMIQQETKQTIARVEDDPLEMRSSFDSRIRLPQRPVSSISSVTLTPPSGGDVQTIDPVTYYLDGDELVRSTFPLHIQGFFAQRARGWLGPLWTLTVIYSHGFDVTPAIVKAVCLEMVVRVWVNPGAVARESIGNTSTVYDNMRFSPSGLVMTDAERDAVNKVIRRNSGSLTLR